SLAMSPASAADLLADHREVARRLRWLDRVGIGHLSIGRSLDTLCGGARQRLLLAAHLVEAPADESLRIVLDERTTGLHGTDVDRLLSLCHDLFDVGTTNVLVEHNQRASTRSYHVVDIGPGAGQDGGVVVYQGPPSGLVEERASVTGHYLRVAGGPRRRAPFDAGHSAR